MVFIDHREVVFFFSERRPLYPRIILDHTIFIFSKPQVSSSLVHHYEYARGDPKTADLLAPRLRFLESNMPIAKLAFNVKEIVVL